MGCFWGVRVSSLGWWGGGQVGPFDSAPDCAFGFFRDLWSDNVKHLAFALRLFYGLADGMVLVGCKD